MTDAINDMAKLLETIPQPAFIAVYDGSIAYANRALAEVTGQRALAEMDRTLFGLGIFHNPAEYRGFLNSFQHGGNTRRLVLPVGRLDVVGKPLILYASRIKYNGQPSLCGVISRSTSPSQKLKQDESLTDDLLGRLDICTIRVNARGRILFMSQLLAQQLGFDTSGPLPKLARVDMENDPASLARYLRQAQSHGRINYETTFQREDGTILPVGVSVAPLPTTSDNPEFVLTIDNLTDRISNEREQERLRRENEELTAELKRSSVPDAQPGSTEESYRIISRSAPYQRILRQARQVAPTDSTVLITGETGTGKELIAQAIHRQSLRSDKPLIILNCGALPSELIESELFGYRKGAFTGARSDYIGRFELADGGTLFLDEIGEMPITLQTRLLRVLQDGQITPLGAKQAITTDVRIIAATNRNLREQIAEGNFRSDLFFRLNVFPIHSIPLRERREDIPLLVDHFIEKHSSGQSAPYPRVSAEDMERLYHYPFRGNVRELENIIQRALVVSDGDRLDIELEGQTDGTPPTAPTASTPATVTPAIDTAVLDFDSVQRQHIERVLAMTEGKVSGKDGAAALLGLNPQTLFSKIRKFGINRKSTS